MRMQLDETVDELVEVLAAGLASNVLAVGLHGAAAAGAEPPATPGEGVGTASARAARAPRSSEAADLPRAGRWVPREAPRGLARRRREPRVWIWSRELEFSTSARSGVVHPIEPRKSDEIPRVFGPTWRSPVTVRLLRRLASWLSGDPAGFRVGSWCRRCASRWPGAGQRRSSMALPRRPFGSPVVPESWWSGRPRVIGCTLAKTAGSAFFSTMAH